jgi:hypothetical protein
MGAGPGFAFIIISIVVFVLIVLIMRLIGAWMLRINEVIRNQQTQIEMMKSLLNKMENNKPEE